MAVMYDCLLVQNSMKCVALVSTGNKIVQPISVGRVGIRCVHCRDRPVAEQAKGAVSYPTSIRMLNQATRNWQRYHWGTCQFIPPSVRGEFERLQAETFPLRLRLRRKGVGCRKGRSYERFGE